MTNLHGAPWDCTIGHVHAMECTMVHTMDPLTVSLPIPSPWKPTLVNHGYLHGVPRGLSN